MQAAEEVEVEWWSGESEVGSRLYIMVNGAIRQTQ